MAPPGLLIVEDGGTGGRGEGGSRNQGRKGGGDDRAERQEAPLSQRITQCTVQWWLYNIQPNRRLLNTMAVTQC